MVGWGWRGESFILFFSSCGIKVIPKQADLPLIIIYHRRGGFLSLLFKNEGNFYEDS